MVEGNQLLDATIVASLAILLSSSRVTQMHNMPEPKVSIVATKAMVTKAMAIKTMVLVILVVMGSLLVGPMPLMPMSSRGIYLISLKGINQSYLVIMSIRLMRLSQKTAFRYFSL